LFTEECGFKDITDITNGGEELVGCVGTGGKGKCGEFHFIVADTTCDVDEFLVDLAEVGPVGPYVPCLLLSVGL
jgi:hypothetical protein